ncbi:MAG: hypothetical protein NC827_05910 [Candidatus Omnitrophica bacterium]|nr:hypothetical protein [Candidatus Omnitrophota bacterium]
MLRSVEKTHKNLGLPIVFTKLVDISNMGLFVCADRGKGKTRIIYDSQISLSHRDILKISILTYAGIVKVAKEINEKSITIINPDFSSFYTDYLKDVAVNLMANLLTEHSVRASTGKYVIQIQNCNCSFLSAIQPRLLSKLTKISAWESMYKDRFLRFHLLYPLGTPTYVEYPPNVPRLDYIDMNPNNVVIPQSIKRMKEYEKLKFLLMLQTSEGRCEDYVDRLLKASAWFNTRDTVVESDVQFLNLFFPYLFIDYVLSRREIISSPLDFNPNSFLLFAYIIEKKEATRRELKEHFKVSWEALKLATDDLLSLGLIKGSFRKPNYFVNPKFDEKYLKPIRYFYENYVY